MSEIRTDTIEFDLLHAAKLKIASAGSFIDFRHTNWEHPNEKLSVKLLIIKLENRNDTGHFSRLSSGISPLKRACRIAFIHGFRLNPEGLKLIPSHLQLRRYTWVKDMFIHVSDILDVWDTYII